MRPTVPLLLIAALSTGVPSIAQSAPTAVQIDHYTSEGLIAHAKQAGGETPLFTEIPAKYPNHYTMLVSRHADGQSEFHQRYADVIVILKGEGEITTGGSMVGARQTAAGEQRGSGISGGTTAPLKCGDIVHIPAGIPHQVKLHAGGNITYFVVKVDQAACANSECKPN